MTCRTVFCGWKLDSAAAALMVNILDLASCLRHESDGDRSAPCWISLLGLLIIPAVELLQKEMQSFVHTHGDAEKETGCSPEERFIDDVVFGAVQKLQC